MQVTNPGSSQIAFSSLISFHLLDSQNHQYGEDVTGAGLNPTAPDGQIAGGQSIRGFVVFDVPAGATGLKFRAQGSPTAAGRSLDSMRNARRLFTLGAALLPCLEIPAVQGRSRPTFVGTSYGRSRGTADLR